MNQSTPEQIQAALDAVARVPRHNLVFKVTDHEAALIERCIAEYRYRAAIARASEIPTKQTVLREALARGLQAILEEKQA